MSFRKNQRKLADAIVRFSLDKGKSASKGLNKYKIIKELGRGAFGKVVEALEKKTNKRVAIKIQLNYKNSDLFKKEINILQKVSKFCENLVCIKDSGIIENGMHYIVMEYASGVNLEKYMLKYKPEISDILMIIDQVIWTTKILHDNDIAHSDIKPENIQVDPETLDIKILDLGLACDDIEYCGGGGTKFFLPKTYEKDILGRKSTDVYAIGVVLLLMLVDWEDKDIVKRTYNIIGSKDFRKIILKTVIPDRYFKNPDISYILKYFLSPEEVKRIKYFEKYFK